MLLGREISKGVQGCDGGIESRRLLESGDRLFCLRYAGIRDAWVGEKDEPSGRLAKGFSTGMASANFPIPIRITAICFGASSSSGAMNKRMNCP